MSQHDYNLANASGSAFRGDLNSVLQAIASNNKGPTRPSTIVAGQSWLDDNTPSASVWTLNLYDGTDDIALGTFDTTTNAFTATAAATPSQIASGTSNVEVTSSGGPIDHDTNGSLRYRIDASGRHLFGGETAPATGFGAAGDFTLPIGGRIRSRSTPGFFVNFVGTTGVVSDSDNVTSVTRNSAGSYRVNITNAMPSVNWTPWQSISGGGNNLHIMNVTARATTYADITASGMNSGSSTIFAADATMIAVGGFGG